MACVEEGDTITPDHELFIVLTEEEGCGAIGFEMDVLEATEDVDAGKEPSLLILSVDEDICHDLRCGRPPGPFYCPLGRRTLPSRD